MTIKLNENNFEYILPEAEPIDDETNMEHAYIELEHWKERALKAEKLLIEKRNFQPWIPYLSDRADGVQGHYAISRLNHNGYHEHWNVWSHKWSSASEQVLTFEQANQLLQKLEIPTKPKPEPDFYTAISPETGARLWFESKREAIIFDMDHSKLKDVVARGLIYVD